MLNDPNMSLIERKIYNENPTFNKEKIKKTIEVLQSQVDSNNQVKNLNRSFNDKDNACINKWKSFQSNIFHDKNKKSLDFKLENTHQISSVKPSKLNTTKNSTNVSFTDHPNDNIEDLVFHNKSKAASYNFNIKSTRDPKSKLRWISGLDWKKVNTEVLFHDTPKITENYSCKKQKLKDFQSSINEYEYSKHSQNPSKTVAKSKGYDMFKRIMPYYTEVRKVDKVNEINAKERKDIMKTILEHNTNKYETEGSKLKKMYNTSVFQGSEFSKTHYDTKTSTKGKAYEYKVL